MAQKNPNVLVVDDDPSLTDLLVDTLAVIGYQACAADSASAALAIMRKQQIDLVISDINMPEMSGIELLQEIKKINSQTPVMLITGVGSESIKDRAYTSGADGYLEKPFRIGTMEQEIGKLLRGVRRRRIALIDDNEEFLNSLSQRLEASDNVVYRFTTIRAASTFLETNPVDMIITDLKMPDGSGVSLFRKIHQKFPRLPVVMVSAYATREVLEQLKGSGISRFLAKPINFDELESIVSSCTPERN